jgi:hypothetical protein
MTLVNGRAIGTCKDCGLPVNWNRSRNGYPTRCGRCNARRTVERLGTSGSRYFLNDVLCPTCRRAFTPTLASMRKSVSMHRPIYCERRCNPSTEVALAIATAAKLRVGDAKYSNPLCRAPVPGGCDHPRKILGFCSAHYVRHKHGMPVDVVIKRRPTASGPRVQKADPA